MPKRQDLLQSLMDSRTADEAGGDRLYAEEVGANGGLLYAAAYETSSSTMAFMTHYLVKDQKLQERLYAEIEQLIENDGRLDYNTVMELPLLDAVIKETLRLNPPVTDVTRECIVDYHYKPVDGAKGCPEFVIPKGSAITVGIRQLSLDPAYWDKPTEFNPDRFLQDPVTGEKPTINSMVYMPFGVGPRHCIGQRFAMLNLKLTYARLLAKFRFEPSERSVLGKVEMVEGNFIQHPTGGVWCKVVKRVN
jgi:cytochrome P450 family 9